MWSLADGSDYSPSALWALHKVHILVLDHYSYLRYHIYCLRLCTHSATREKNRVFPEAAVPFMGFSVRARIETHFHFVPES